MVHWDGHVPGSSSFFHLLISSSVVDICVSCMTLRGKLVDFAQLRPFCLIWGSENEHRGTHSLLPGKPNLVFWPCLRTGEWGSLLYLNSLSHKALAFACLSRTVPEHRLFLTNIFLSRLPSARPSFDTALTRKSSRRSNLIYVADQGFLSGRTESLSVSPMEIHF